MKTDTMKQEKSYEMNSIFIGYTHLSTFKGADLIIMENNIKSSTMERINKVNKLKKYLLATFPEGKFSANTYSFNNEIGVKGQITPYMEILIKEGFIKKVKNAKKGKNYQPAEYEIISCMPNDDIKSNIEKDEEIHSKVDVNDFIEKNFNNVPMRLYRTEKGYVVPISNIVIALNVDRQLIHQLISKNKEIFKEFVVNVTLTASKSGDNTCLTRDGVIGLLMKISYNRLTPDKKKLVLEFQKWAIEKLGQLISTGEVKISSQEQHSIKTNVANTIGVSEEDIEKLLVDIRNSLDDNIKKVKSLFDGKNEEILLAKSERDIANEREKQVLAKVSQMVDQRFQIMLDKMA